MRTDPLADMMAMMRTPAPGSRSIDSTQHSGQLTRPNARAVARNESAASQSPGRAVESTVALRVAALAGDDPERNRKAMRIFLETTLLRAFGTSLRLDPGFDALVDQVQLQMESDPSLLAACRQAADSLLIQSAVVPVYAPAPKP